MSNDYSDAYEYLDKGAPYSDRAVGSDDVLGDGATGWISQGIVNGFPSRARMELDSFNNLRR